MWFFWLVLNYEESVADGEEHGQQVWVVFGGLGKFNQSKGFDVGMNFGLNHLAAPQHVVGHYPASWPKSR